MPLGLTKSLSVFQLFDFVAGWRRDKDYGYGSLSLGDGKASNFAGMRHFLAVHSTCDFTKFATRRLNRCEFSVWRLNESINETDCVH